MGRAKALVCTLILVVACSDDGLSPASDETSAGTEGTASGTGQGSGVSTTSAGSDSGSGDSAPSGSGTTADPENDLTGGDSSGGVDTAGPGAGACTVDGDCQVVDDCCTCGAVAVSEEPPACDLQECFAPKCTELSFPSPTPVCRFGTCELVPTTCNANLVTCLAPTPLCEEGLVASVSNGCWTGQCVPASLCDVVPDCSYCTDAETCVASETQLGPEYACEPIAPACEGKPSCECMDPCTEPFSCVDGTEPGTELTCICPACAGGG